MGLLSVSDHEMTAGNSLEGDRGKLLLLVVLRSDADRNKDGVDVTFLTGGVAGAPPPLVLVMDAVDDMKKLNKSSFFSSGGAGSRAFSEAESSVLILASNSNGYKGIANCDVEAKEQAPMPEGRMKKISHENRNGSGPCARQGFL